MTSFLPLLVFSQKDFEGVITYKGFKNSPQDSFGVKFFVSNGKIKIRIDFSNTDEVKDEESTIHDFVNGLEYFLDDGAKSFSVDSMETSSFDDINTIFKDTLLPQNILGYMCRAYILNREQELPGLEFSAITWHSDSVRFTVPPKYRGKSSFESLPDGNMLFLKSVAYYSSGSAFGKNKIDSFVVAAEQIEKITLDKTEFLPPAGFSKVEAEMEVTTIPHSLSVILEEIKKEPSKKPAPAKPSKPSQSPANKVKEPKPVKG